MTDLFQPSRTAIASRGAHFIAFLAKEQHRRNAGCGKAKHDKVDHPVLLQILTGQAGKSSETMQPERAAGHEVHEF
jgi:hypothetical protein